MQYVTILKAPAGLGKTTKVIKKLAHTGWIIEYYAPTHALAEEVRLEFLKQNPALTVNVIRGRSLGCGGASL